MALKTTSIHLIMADMIHGVTLIFGVEVEEGTDLYDYLDADKGARFIEVIGVQTLSTRNFVMCPRCEALTAIEGSSECSACKLPFSSPVFEEAQQAGTIRILPRTGSISKPLSEGTEGKSRLRPEHIVSYDTICAKTAAYRAWNENRQLTREKILERDTGIKLVSPSGLIV
jgi:hypothetical protein